MQRNPWTQSYGESSGCLYSQVNTAVMRSLWMNVIKKVNASLATEDFGHAHVVTELKLSTAVSVSDPTVSEPPLPLQFSPSYPSAQQTGV